MNENEWTVKTVLEMFQPHSVKGDVIDMIIKSHNAALAAAKENSLRDILDWERGYKCGKAECAVVIDELREQLAAEREKVAGLHEACRAEANHSRQLRDQLAAERERTKTLVDALKEVELYRHSWDTTHPCSLVADIAKDALSKVNQNWIRAEDNPGFHRHE